MALRGGTNIRIGAPSRSSRYLRPSATRCVEIVASLELVVPVRLVVEIPVEHDLEPTLRCCLAQIVDERPVFVQGVHRPAAAERLRYALAGTGAVERNNSQGDGTQASQIAVRLPRDRPAT